LEPDCGDYSGIGAGLRGVGAKASLSLVVSYGNICKSFSTWLLLNYDESKSFSAD